MGLFNFFTEEIAIDLGTANTLIIHDDKVVVDSPSIVAIDQNTGKVIAVVTEGDTIVSHMADHCIWVPETDEYLTPLLSSIPLQLFAYYIAVNKGRDVDQPRNLAKSVTVE